MIRLLPAATGLCLAPAGSREPAPTPVLAGEAACLARYPPDSLPYISKMIRGDFRWLDYRRRLLPTLYRLSMKTTFLAFCFLSFKVTPRRIPAATEIRVGKGQPAGSHGALLAF